MNFQDKTKEELLYELDELLQKYNSVLSLYEQKSEEVAQLQECGNNIEAIIGNSLESIWSVAKNYRVQYINKVFADFFKQIHGIELKTGVNILELLPADQKIIWEERCERAFRGEHFVVTDKIENNNELVYIETDINPVIINGEVTGASFFGHDITNRILAEEALKESETRFKALHNASFGGIAIHDKGIILECNHGLSAITGYAVEELVGMNGLLLISEKSREYTMNMILSGYEKPYEITGIRKNGSEYPLRVEGRNIPYKGKMVRVTEFRDITEQKQAENAFWESQVNFKALFEKGPIGVAYHRMIYDENGKPVDYFYIDANKSFQKITGINPVGKRVTEAFPGIENDPFDWIGTYGEVAKTGKEIRIQQPLQFNNRWYDCVAYQYKPDHFVAAFFDITEQKQTEISLKEWEEIFSHFMENSPVYIFFKDKNIRTIRLSRNFEQLTGKPNEEMIGKTMEELFPGKFARKIIADDKKVLAEGKPMVIDEDFNGRFFTTIKFPIIINGEAQYIAGYTIDVTERKKAEDKLKSSEERLSIIFNYAPDACYLCDLKGVFIDGNIAAEKMLGYDKHELIGKSFYMLNLLPKKYIPVASKLLAKNILGLKAGPEELELIKKDGAVVWVEISTHPVKIEDQTLVFGIARDISERKKAEKLIQQASENWKRTFQSMHSGIALLDENQKIIQTNRAFLNFVSKEEKDVVGKNGFFYLSPHILNENPFEKMLKSKTCEKTEVVLNVKHFEILVDPIFDQEGKINGAVQIMNDVTQRWHDENVQQILYEITSSSLTEKTIEELLHIVRIQLSKIIDTTNFFVAFYNPVTETLRKVIFEDEKDDFIEWDVNKSLSGQVVKLGKPMLLNLQQALLFAKQNNFAMLGTPAECWLGVPLLNGEKVFGVMVVQSYSNEKAYDSSTVRLMELIAHELSLIFERKKMIEDLVAAKEKAEESDRLKSAFLANMSHEIRTPMNGILGFAELLKEPKLTGEEQQMFIDIIMKSGERMINIINDLVSISKIESGQIEVSISETNINEQLGFLYNFFYPEAKQKELNFIVNCTLPDDKSVVLTDKEKVYAVLTNLIKNAIKFTKNGFVEFGYNLSGEEIVFYVKDSGIGIAREKQNTVFDRFVQVFTEKTGIYEGAGLGLSISKAYVEILGGKIWLESEEGKGTCVYFKIPASLKTEEEVSVHHISGSGINNKKQKPTILITDDDEISLMYLLYLLEDCSGKILEARNGAQAVELCQKLPEIDLVLMDINMPEMDGYTATKMIKEFRPDLPVIAQTAYALYEEKEKYSNAFDDYLTKPIDSNELIFKINKYLNCFYEFQG